MKGKKWEYPEQTTAGAGGLFQSQTGQRWIVTGASALSPQLFSPVTVLGVTVSLSLVLHRKREDGHCVIDELQKPA